MMSFFSSNQEKRLWFGVLLVLLAIGATLIFGQPLTKLFSSQDLQAAIFLLGMVLIGGMALYYSWRKNPTNSELIVWVGLIAVYLLLFLRLGLPERSHLIEYSVLAIFIHAALVERIGGKKTMYPALIALVATTLIGVLDECSQLFLPHRVFDIEDMIFNGLAALMAIGGRVILQWARKFGKN